MKFYLWLVFILIIIGVSCKEDVPGAEPETLVSGTVTEGNSKQPIKGAKILVWEYRRTDDLFKSQSYRYKAIDSVLTDGKGYYSIRFQSSRSSDSYRPEYHLSKKYYYNYNNGELSTATNNVRNVLVYEAKILKARVIYSENPYPPLILQTWSRINDLCTLNLLKLYTVRGDTTVTLKIIPDNDNIIAFSYNNGYTPYFYSETFNQTFSSDTLLKTFTIHPKDFKR